MFQEKIKQGTSVEDDVHLDDTQSEDGDCGHLLDLVYDAVITGQSPCELQKSIKRWALGAKWGSSRVARSTD